MATKDTVLRDIIIDELNFVTSWGRNVFLCPFIGRSKKQMFGFFITITLILCTSVQLFTTILSYNTSDLLEMINVVPNLGVCLMSFIKYSKVQMHIHLYEKMFLHFQDEMWDVVSTESETHKKIIFKYKRFTKYINRFLLYYSIPLTIVVDSFPYLVMKFEEKFLNIEEYLYPFEAWYPFDKEKHYGAAYIWESCMTAVVVFVYGSTNCIHVTYIIFTCMELKILGNCLEELLTLADVNNIKTGTQVKVIYGKAVKKLKLIIKRHELLAKQSGALDSILGDAMLLNYSLGAVFICLTAFTSTVIDNVYKQLRYAFMCLSLLVEVFSQCFIGQILCDHSEDLTNSIYASNWPHASPEIKKILLMFMMRTQKPFQLTANGYLVMNMDTFSRICSTSYQFFNLLRTMYA